MEMVKKFSGNLSGTVLFPKKKLIKKYFAKQIQKANKEPDHPVKKNLHRLRKRLKMLMYIYEALPVKLQKSFGLYESNIDKLQKRLGIWHDTYSAIQFFSRQRFSGKDKYISKLKVKERRNYRDIFHGELKIAKGVRTKN